MKQLISNSTKTGRIANNTMLLYLRMLFLMIINLYTVRVVLLALGVENYGIYSAVAGVVTMINCINSVMSNATQRFYSFYIGRQDLVNLKRVFSVSLDVYIIIIIFVFLIGETLGVWFVNNKLVIPDERLFAGNVAFQLSIFSFSATMISMPFLSAILAHEKIGIYSIFTTVEYLVKLLLALSLTYINGDVLIFYASFDFFVQFMLMLGYVIYGRVVFPECKYSAFRRQGMHKEVISFSGWTLFGSIAGIGMNQIMTILYNIFFGPIVTACRAISLQLNTALTAFSNSFITAIRPPMIKSYSEKNDIFLMKLFTVCNKFVFYSLTIIAIPLLLEMRSILGLWLDIHDSLTINYSRLMVVYFIIMAIGNPITIIIQAIGKVKEYYLRVEFFTLLCPLLTYCLFKYGMNSYYGYFAMIFTILLSHLSRLVCLKKLYSYFSLTDYFLHFVLPALMISFLSFASSFFTRYLFGSDLIRFVMVLFVSLTIIIVLVYYFNLDKSEKESVKNVLNEIRVKFINSSK